MKKKRIVVTGNAGFIGSHLVDSLIDLGHEVFGIDDLSGGYLENVNPKCNFKKLDLRNEGEVKKYINKVKPQYLFHLAADAAEGRSQFTPISSTQRNYNAYMNILIPSIKNGLEKVIVTSSMSVYGSQKPPFSENMPRKPDDIYGIAKAAMESATEVLSRVYGFKYTIVRPHNVYGEKQNLADPYRNVAAIFINRLLSNKHFYIYGNGKQKRSFTYIDDFIPYFIKAGFSSKCDGEIINIGPKDEVSINELAKIVLDTFYPNGKVPQRLLPKYLPLRPQEVSFAWCTVDKAEKLLGFKQTVTLRDGIERMVIWAKQQGPQKFKYLKSLELTHKNTPVTWTKKLI